MWLYPQHLFGERDAAKLCAARQTLPRVAGETRHVPLFQNLAAAKAERVAVQLELIAERGKPKR